MLLDGVRKGVGRETQMEDMRFFVGATFGCGSGHRDTSSLIESYALPKRRAHQGSHAP